MGEIKPTHLKPVKGYVLATPIEDQSSETMIIAGDEPTPQWAKVLAVGDKTWHEGIAKVYDSPCEVGDTVIHSSFGYEGIRIETKEYRLVPFGRILARITKKP